MVCKNGMTRGLDPVLAMPLCLVFLCLIKPTFLLRAGLIVLVTVVLLASHFLSSRSHRLFCRPYSLSRRSLVAVSVVFKVVVFSFCLLVTEEVAPPAFRVVHLSGCPSALHLPHLPFV